MKTWLLALLLISALSLCCLGRYRHSKDYRDARRWIPIRPRPGIPSTLPARTWIKPPSPICTSPTEKTTPKIAVMEHTADKIKFQVPRIKPGRYHIAFLTANKASMIEQPVVLTVE